MRYLAFISVCTFVLLSCDNDVNINVPDPNNFPPNSSNCLKAEGAIEMQNRVISDPYNRIESYIFADVFITQGPFEDLVLEGQPNILEQIPITVVNGTLIFDLDRCIDSNEAIKVYIVLPELKSIIQAGAGDITAQNDLILTELRVELEGLGDISLQGSVEVLDIEIEPGLGNVKAFDLVSDFCEVRLEGIGDVEVFVNEELDVVLSGIGNVYYKGNPTITSNITGTGSVIDAN